MSGRSRLPSGEPRRASQKRTRPAAPKLIEVAEIPWRAGDKVRWRDCAGTYRRDTGDGEHAISAPEECENFGLLPDTARPLTQSW
jgi:hypothetical protein